MPEKPQRHPRKAMPPLTIDGKRSIIDSAIKNRGEKAVLAWLKERDISSIRSAYENVRKYKAKFFRELNQL